MTEPEKIDQTKNHKLSFFFALVASLCFGVANYIQALLAKSVGPIESMMVQAPHFILAWLMYHLLQLRKRPFFDKENSEYYPDKTTKKFSWKRFSIPLLRMAVLIVTVVVGSAGYYYGDFMGINSGILTALQGVAVIVNIIIFQVKYGQKLSCADTTGVILIMVSIVGISFGGAMDINAESVKDAVKEQSDRIFYLSMAIGLTLFSGVIHGFRPLTMQYSMDIGFDQTQSHFDSMMMLGVFWMPYYIKYYAYDDNVFGWYDFWLSVIILFSVNGALVAIGLALQYGNSGILMALENTKPIPQIILVMLIDGIFPNWIQVVFMFLGIFAAMFIICMRTVAKIEEPMKATLNNALVEQVEMAEKRQIEDLEKTEIYKVMPLPQESIEAEDRVI